MRLRTTITSEHGELESTSLYCRRCMIPLEFKAASAHKCLITPCSFAIDC